jgi:hypothetical protein
MHINDIYITDGLKKVKPRHGNCSLVEETEVKSMFRASSSIFLRHLTEQESQMLTEALEKVIATAQSSRSCTEKEMYVDGKHHSVRWGYIGSVRHIFAPRATASVAPSIDILSPQRYAR